LGILTTYWIFEELHIQRNLALLAVIVLAINPLYFQLSLTFMTDVPFCPFSMFAALFFLRALRTEKVWHIMVG
jgi:4-amino-4-deoxy-L-arabinose transferase-like glycosyltransferase